MTTGPSTTPARRTPVTLGDERERSIVNEASGVGMTAGIYAGLGVSVVAAVLGSLAIPVVVLALTAVPALVTMWWAKRRGVDMNDLVAEAPLRTRGVVWAVVGVGMLLVLGALAWTLVTGDGLVTLPTVEIAGPDASGPLSSLARGAVIGGTLGVLVAVVATLLPRRRRSGK